MMVQSKAVSSQPTIEVYPIVTIQSSQPTIEAFPKVIIQNPKEEERNIVRDVWQGYLFPASMIFPVKNITLVSSGTKDPMHLQIPNQTFKVLECLYGNWKVPSKKRAGTKNCVQD